MVKTWINKNNNQKCILFFNGWGMDKNVVTDIHMNDFDICMLNGYSAFSLSKEVVSDYKYVFVVAWSLGVSMANMVMENSNIQTVKKVAFNGTPLPVHEKWGIPENTFISTLDNWDDRNRLKFDLRMFGGKSQYDASGKYLSKRNIESQKGELKFFYDNRDKFQSKNILWDKVCIGTNDLIIPYQNQKNYWKNKANAVDYYWAHFPFLHFKTWKEIVEI